MKTNFQAELEQIRENYNMGFITSYEAIAQIIDTLQAVTDEIENEDEREAWRESVYATHRDNEHLASACEEIMEQWIGK